MAQLKHTLDVDAPVSRVDEIVRDPHQWARFWVGMSEPDKVFGDGGPGTKVEMTVTFMGVHLRLIERTVEERHNDDGSTDWRWQMEGALTATLSCHHEPRGESSTINTEFDYTMPGSVLGKAVDRLLIEKRMRRDFEDSLENLKLMAEMPVAASPS